MVQERFGVLEALEVRRPDRGFERLSQVWPRLQQLDQVFDHRDMPSRLLRCLITGAGGQDDKREKDTQHGYPPRVAQEHSHAQYPRLKVLLEFLCQCSHRPLSLAFSLSPAFCCWQISLSH